MCYLNIANKWIQTAACRIQEYPQGSLITQYGYWSSSQSSFLSTKQKTKKHIDIEQHKYCLKKN